MQNYLPNPFGIAYLVHVAASDANNNQHQYTMTTKIKAYYSGNYAYDCNPTPGNWDGVIFTATDGSKWTFDPLEGDPRIDGTDTHYLIPATTHTP